MPHEPCWRCCWPEPVCCWPPTCSAFLLLRPGLPRPCPPYRLPNARASAARCTASAVCPENVSACCCNRSIPRNSRSSRRCPALWPGPGKIRCLPRCPDRRSACAALSAPCRAHAMPACRTGASGGAPRACTGACGAGETAPRPVLTAAPPFPVAGGTRSRNGFCVPCCPKSCPRPTGSAGWLPIRAMPYCPPCSLATATFLTAMCWTSLPPPACCTAWPFPGSIWP